jgi:CheY-like chemotaxis protein
MKAKLFLLEDQVQYARSLERALKRDYDIVFASNMQEAKEKMVVDAQLVLSDKRLDESKQDDHQGLEFIQWLRLRNGTIPIIAMSALDDPSIEQEALCAGANRFLRKPIVVTGHFKTSQSGSNQNRPL